MQEEKSPEHSHVSAMAVCTISALLVFSSVFQPTGAEQDRDIGGTYRPVHYNSYRDRSHLSHTHASDGQMIELEFQAYGRLIQLRLFPDKSVFSVKHGLYFPGKQHPEDTMLMYTGEVRGEPGSRVRGAVSGGVFRGTIWLADGTLYVVEPSEHLYRTPQPFRSVIARLRGPSPATQERTKRSPTAGRGRLLTPATTLCPLFVRTDPSLMRYMRVIKQFSVSRARREILILIASHVTALNDIFEPTFFQTYPGNEDKEAYTGIHFKLLKTEIMPYSDCETEDLQGFCNESLDAATLLGMFSRSNHDEYCLAYLFTFREFPDGRHGMAWEASPNDERGVCGRYGLHDTGDGEESSSLNTGVLSVGDHNGLFPVRTSQLNFAHLVGHSFGAKHDTADLWNDYCEPGDEDAQMGRYLMYRVAPDGSRENSERFSSCSKDNITRVLGAVLSERNKTNCLRESDCGQFFYGPGCTRYCKQQDDDSGHYTCSHNGTVVCMDGWQGEYCDHVKCLPGCDKERAICGPPPNRCQCVSGWQGRLCDRCVTLDGCLHGTCRQPHDCICDPGWAGYLCARKLLCFDGGYCLNNGTCEDSDFGDALCRCPRGFTGLRCEQEDLSVVCDTNPCQNGGSCSVDRSGSANFRCDCPMEYTGRTCADRVGITTAPADQEAARCPPNFYGSNCTVYCRPANGFYGHYTCDEDGAKVCDHGWRGPNCRNLYCEPECESEKSYCSYNPMRCICRRGWTGTDCQQCVPAGGCRHGSCARPDECNCDPGWAGVSCERRLFCHFNINPCQNGGRCVDDSFGQYACDCSLGYKGAICSQSYVNCEMNPCRNGATCMPRFPWEKYTFKCVCPPGFTGERCDAADPRYIDLVLD